jgi:hypothetical protein
VKKNKPVLIGIDLSILEPGIAIYNPDIDSNTVMTYNFPKGNFQCSIRRYNRVAEKLANHIFLHRSMGFTDFKIMIEDYAAGGAGKTNDIAENGGILKYKLLYEYSIKPTNILLCSISHLKMFVASHGKAKKELMIKEVYKKWNFDTNNNNEADAFGLLMVLKSMYYPNEIKLTAYQKEILERIVKYNKDNSI